jgi:glucose/arabinose dehydrogenase
MKMMKRRHQVLFPGPLGQTVAVLALVVPLGGLLSAQKNTVQQQPQADRLPPVSVPSPNRGNMVEKPSDVMPMVPAGFTVSVYAEVQSPRLMVYAPNGDLFISSPATNSITVLRDTNNDGVFEQRGVYAQGDPPPARSGGPAPTGPQRPAPAAQVNPAQNGPVLGANAPACAAPPAFHSPGPGTVAAPFGMAFNNGYLYVGNTGSIVRFKYANGDLKAQGAPEKLLDMPVGGHSTRNIAFNRAGTKMYVAVGSQSNNNAGEDCRRAAVLEFNPDGTGYRVFASGLRNPVGLALQPGTDTLWTTVNERDNLGDDLVPDYATSLKDGGFYGWPYSYIGKHSDPRYPGAFPDQVNRAVVPDVLIPSHSAPLGITFYTGTQFPQRYRNGGFVALHGSWNRSVASGYKVVFFPMSNGRPGALEDFMTGFLSNDGEGGVTVERWGRPVAVTTAADGALLVSDDGGHRIWKISAAR